MRGRMSKMVVGKFSASALFATDFTRLIQKQFHSRAGGAAGTPTASFVLTTRESFLFFFFLPEKKKRKEYNVLVLLYFTPPPFFLLFLGGVFFFRLWDFCSYKVGKILNTSGGCEEKKFYVKRARFFLHAAKFE